MSVTLGDTKVAVSKGYELPWAGCAKLYDADGLSIDKLFREGGLDFQVVNVPVYTGNPDDGFTEIPNFRATKRSDDGWVFNVGGTRRDEYQTSEARELAEAVAGLGAKPVGALSFEHGAKYAIELAREPFTVGPDTIQPYLFVSSSHDGSLSTAIGWSDLVSVCYNTFMMNVGTAKSQVSVRHTASQRPRLAIAVEALAAHDQHLAAIRQNIEAMLSRKVSQKTALSIFEQLFPMPENPDEAKRAATIAEKMRDLAGDIYNSDTIAEKRGTEWAVYNVATEISNHHLTRKNTEANTAAENRSFALLFGTDRLAERTLELIAVNR